MSDVNEGLVVHLIMDAIDENGTVPDASGRGHHGRSFKLGESGPDLTEAPEAGGVLKFRKFKRQLTIGRTDELGIFDASFTATVWVYFVDDVEKPTRLVFTTTSIPLQECGNLDVPFSFGIQSELVRMTLHPESPLRSEKNVESNRWHHIAFRYDRSSQEQSIFIDGTCDAKGECPPFIEEWLDDIPEQMVGVGDSDPTLFMCDLRCYNRALSDEDIQVIADPKYRKQITIPVNREPVQAEPFPIEFELLDTEDQPVLSSRSPTGQQLTLQVKNTTPGEIQLANIPAHSTGQDRYHFILRFRKGILSNIDEIKLAAIGDGWRLDLHHPEQRHEQFDELCFHCESAMTLSPGNDACLLTLTKVRADEKHGTRNSRVELLYRNLNYKDQSIKGYREQTFSVVNKLPPEASEVERTQRKTELDAVKADIEAVKSNIAPGPLKTKLDAYESRIKEIEKLGVSSSDQKYLKDLKTTLDSFTKEKVGETGIQHLKDAVRTLDDLKKAENNPRGSLPLHVGFDGSNTVLNDKNPSSNSDGTKTTLTLKLTALGSHDGIAFGRDSKFVLGFDIATDDQSQAWALCDSGEVDINPTLDMGGWKNPELPTTGTVGDDPRYKWTFERDQPGYAVLEPDRALTLTIANIHSSMPSGPTNLYLGYENIYTATKENDDGNRGTYKDSHFILQVIKTPLFFGNKNVGIGTTAVQGNRLTVEGNVKVDGDIKITGKNYLEFGTGVAGKEVNAGKIGYQIWSSGSLDIVGAGDGINRRIKFFAEGDSRFDGPVTIDGNVTLKEKLSHETGTVTIVGDLKVTGRVSDKTGLVIPVGTILPYVGPKGKKLYEYIENYKDWPYAYEVEGQPGWLICDGGYAVRTEYPELFAVLQQNESTVDPNNPGWFRLPNLQGRIPVGKEVSGTFKKLGHQGGHETHVLTEAEMPRHNHYFNYDKWWHFGLSNTSWDNDSGRTVICQNGTPGDPNKVIANAGSSQAHNNLQPYMVVNYIIKF